MSATRYIVQVNGQPLVTRSRKEQAMPVYTAEAANAANVVVLITNTGKVLETNQSFITTETATPAPVVLVQEILEQAAETPAAPVEETKEPVEAPETTDSALEFLKAEIERTTAQRAALANASRIPSPIPALEAAMTPASVAPDAVPNTKRPKSSAAYIINVSGQPGIHVAGGKAKAEKEFDLQVKANPAAIITMSTAKGNQVKYYDGPGVQAKAINDANPDAPLVTPARPSRKRTAPKAAPAAPVKRVPVAKTAEKPARKAAKKATKAAAKKTVMVKVDGRKNPAAPRWTSAPGQVRDQVIEFLNRTENLNRAFTSVEIMHGLNRDNGVNNISTALADRGEIAWASKAGEVKRFTSLKSTRLLKKLGLAPEKKTARKATASK